MERGREVSEEGENEMDGKKNGGRNF